MRVSHQGSEIKIAITTVHSNRVDFFFCLQPAILNKNDAGTGFGQRPVSFFYNQAGIKYLFFSILAILMLV